MLSYNVTLHTLIVFTKSVFDHGSDTMTRVRRAGGKCKCNYIKTSKSKIMLRREAMIRAGLVQYYCNIIHRNKTHVTDPFVYANIPWAVANLALERAYDENDSSMTKLKILRHVTCFNRGLLAYLMSQLNSFTY